MLDAHAFAQFVSLFGYGLAAFGSIAVVICGVAMAYQWFSYGGRPLTGVAALVIYALVSLILILRIVSIAVAV